MRLRLRVPTEAACFVLTYWSFRIDACGALYTRDVEDVAFEAEEEPDLRALVKLCCRLDKLLLRSEEGVLSMSGIPGNRFMIRNRSIQLQGTQ